VKVDSSWLAGGIAGEVRIEHENLDLCLQGSALIKGWLTAEGWISTGKALVTNSGW